MPQMSQLRWLLSLLPLWAQAPAPLQSWYSAASRQAIEQFGGAVTEEGGKDFVAPNERIAVFDNDGNLWSEQPMYFEVLFALDDVKRLAPKHPEWKTQQPFKAVLNGNQKDLADSDMDGLLKIVAATHSGISTEAFIDQPRRWLTTAKHPKSGNPYTEMVFQPMLELMDYLRANGFKTYFVSGGEVAFMRAFAEEVGGIPPEQGWIWPANGAGSIPSTESRTSKRKSAGAQGTFQMGTSDARSRGRCQ